jgi:UDP-GlcNAc:undecaprenyl-phosphate GlcNAc-1-phosphate transferase
VTPVQLITFAIAVAASATLTPLVCWLAVRVGLVDRPDPERKLHGRVIPLGGGVAIFLSAVGAVGAVVACVVVRRSWASLWRSVS